MFDDGYRRRTHRYAEVGAAARGFAARLAAHGLRRGDAVVFWAENRPEWIACYWGCVISGIVVVPIDYRSSADFVARIRGLVGARVVLVGDPNLPKGERSVDRHFRTEMVRPPDRANFGIGIGTGSHSRAVKSDATGCARTGGRLPRPSPWNS